MFNIIARRALLNYIRRYPRAEASLLRWYAEMVKADYGSFHELKEMYPDVSIVGDDRVVFNIMGNKYRLVVRVVFAFRTMQIKWFGPHSEYDNVDVATIQPRR